MPRALIVCLAVFCSFGTACGGDGASCDLPAQWSTATSTDGSMCQVNIFSGAEHAVFCGGSSGSWDCACGAVADNPTEFVSADFCDLEDAERVCQAIARCNFPL